MSYDLKKWLIDNKFDRFAVKLYQFGLESMDDLRLLVTEQIIEDLCGKNGVKMTIIFRRKFIKKVLLFNNGQIVNNKRSKKRETTKQFKHEMEAVHALTNKLRETTNCIQITKKIQSQMEKNTKEIKEAIVSDFDELIKVLAMRKKQILQSVDTKHKIVMDRLQEQHQNISETAKNLLIAKQGISKEISEKEQGEERRDSVIDLVACCFAECDKYTPSGYSFVKKAEMKYDAGQSAQIKGYGKLTFNDEQLV